MPASFRMDRYVVDVLLRDLVSHDRSPSTFLVYFFLAVNCGSARNGKVCMSLADIADRTGLSKRSVQAALMRLRRRHLIHSTQEHQTATPVHAVLRPWRAK